MEKELLLKLQKVETEMLKEIDSFCKDSKIEYTLAYGTLLGAVRHDGPIPWDDDVDIAMTRNEYDKFISEWKKAPLDGYYLDEMAPNGNSHINHTKIRKDGTILASKDEYKKNKHNGIWLDVFAIDKIPNNSKLRKKVLFWAKIRLVYTRDFPITKGTKLQEILSTIMLAIPRKVKNKVLLYADKCVKKYNNLNDDYQWICLASVSSLSHFYDKDMMNSYKDIKYDGKTLKSIKFPEKMLTVCYGDWMKYPPIEKRVCGHNPDIIDFGE